MPLGSVSNSSTIAGARGEALHDWRNEHQRLAVDAERSRSRLSAPRLHRPDFVVYRGDTEMAITWIFENEGDRCYVQRQDRVDQISILTWSNLEQDSMTVHNELDAVQLIQAIQQELESRGWRILECCPERRQGGDRRKAPRTSPDRRCHGS